jgi:hypothetical protein
MTVVAAATAVAVLAVVAAVVVVRVVAVVVAAVAVVAVVAVAAVVDSAPLAARPVVHALQMTLSAGGATTGDTVNLSTGYSS